MLLPLRLFRCSVVVTFPRCLRLLPRCYVCVSLWLRGITVTCWRLPLHLLVLVTLRCVHGCGDCCCYRSECVRYVADCGCRLRLRLRLTLPRLFVLFTLRVRWPIVARVVRCRIAVDHVRVTFCTVDWLPGCWRWRYVLVTSTLNCAVVPGRCCWFIPRCYIVRLRYRCCYCTGCWLRFVDSPVALFGRLLYLWLPRYGLLIWIGGLPVYRFVFGAVWIRYIVLPR